VLHWCSHALKSLQANIGVLIENHDFLAESQLRFTQVTASQCYECSVCDSCHAR